MEFGIFELLNILNPKHQGKDTNFKVHYDIKTFVTSSNNRFNELML